MIPSACRGEYVGLMEKRPVSTHGCHAIVALQYYWLRGYLSVREVKRRSLTMGFLTELFSRPRPCEHWRYRASLAVLNTITAAERNEIHIRPTDFPRVPRQGIRR
jgi:hypothetical protein